MRHHALRYYHWAHRHFALLFAGFVLIQFPLTGAAFTTAYYYPLLLIPYLCFLHAERKTHLAAWKQDGSLIGFLVLFGFVLLHAPLTGQPEISRTLRATLVNLSFFLAAMSFMATTPYAVLDRFMRWLGAIAGACALASIIWHHLNPKAHERLLPIGRADTQVLAAFVYNLGVIASIYAASLAGLKNWQRAAYFASALIITAMVFLTQSRMAMICCVLFLLAGLYFHYTPKRKRAFLRTLGGAIAALALAGWVMREPLIAFLNTLLERGDSFRIELWETAIATILNNPWIGSGLYATIEHYHTHSPHNIYLVTALGFGIPGLVLLLAAIGTLLFALVRVGRQNPRWSMLVALLLINSLASGLIDHNRLMRSPAPLWLIFWMPLAWGVGLAMRLKDEAQHMTAPASQTAPH